MEIYCENCDKVLGHYPDEKIPLNVKGHTTCNLCGSRIELFRTGAEASTNAIPEASEAPVDDSSVPEAPVDDSSVIDDIAKNIPILSGRKDKGVRKADFIVLGIGLLILFAIIFIYKPEFDPSKFLPQGLRTELESEMMQNGPGQGDKPPQNIPDMEGLEEVDELEELEEAINLIDEAGKM